MIDIKITPRRGDERGGIVCMPLQSNVPNGRNRWRLVNCPKCGEPCWRDPMVDALVEQQKAVAWCTLCALKGSAV